MKSRLIKVVWQQYGHVYCHLWAVVLTNPVTHEEVWTFSISCLLSLCYMTLRTRLSPISACNTENVGGPGDEANNCECYARSRVITRMCNADYILLHNLQHCQVYARSADTVHMKTLLWPVISSRAFKNNRIRMVRIITGKMHPYIWVILKMHFACLTNPYTWVWSISDIAHPILEHAVSC